MLSPMNKIFASHDFLMDHSEIICSECGWYGMKSESEGECPNCDVYALTEIDDRGVPGEDNLEDFAKEILEQAILFNRIHGASQYSANRTYNMCVELDIHGKLEVEVLDWHEFNKSHSRMEDYLVVPTVKLDVNKPPHFDIIKARDLLWNLEYMIGSAGK